MRLAQNVLVLHATALLNIGIPRSGQDLENRAAHPHPSFPGVHPPPPPLRDQKKYVAICNISNPSLDIFCTVLLSFPRRCCITKRLLEKREAQQIFKPFRSRWRIFPTLLAVTSSYCLNHHMYTLCGLTVL